MRCKELSHPSVSELRQCLLLQNRRLCHHFLLSPEYFQNRLRHLSRLFGRAIESACKCKDPVDRRRREVKPSVAVSNVLPQVHMWVQLMVLAGLCVSLALGGGLKMQPSQRISTSCLYTTLKEPPNADPEIGMFFRPVLFVLLFVFGCANARRTVSKPWQARMYLIPT